MWCAGIVGPIDQQLVSRVNDKIENYNMDLDARGDARGPPLERLTDLPRTAIAALPGTYAVSNNIAQIGYFSLVRSHRA